MSKESAAKFVQAIIDDEELRKRTGTMKPEEAIFFAKEMGYDFTLEELTEVMKDDKELAPEDLESAAGGFIDTGIVDAAESVRERTYCHGNVNGPKHDFEKVLHGEKHLFFIFTLGFDVYKCKLCGYQLEEWI